MKRKLAVAVFKYSKYVIYNNNFEWKIQELIKLFMGLSTIITTDLMKLQKMYLNWSINLNKFN